MLTAAMLLENFVSYCRLSRKRVFLLDDLLQRIVISLRLVSLGGRLQQRYGQPPIEDVIL